MGNRGCVVCREFKKNNKAVEKLIFLKKFLFIYHSHTEREREREAETQAEGEAGSMHREPDVGFDPGLQDRAPGQRQAPNHCATQGFP